MEKFLFNINSTSWFHTMKSGKVIMIEVFLLLMIAATYLGSFGVSYENNHDIEFGTFSFLMILPFLILIVQFVLYANLVNSVSKDIQDIFWKTQLWRFKDPNFSKQMSLYPNWKFKLEELEQKWFKHYGESANDTLENAPLIQKLRGLLLLAAAILGVISGQLF